VYIYIIMSHIFMSVFFRSDSGHQRPPAQLGALRGLRRNQARRRRLGDEFAPGGESEMNLHNALGTPRKSRTQKRP